MRTWCEVRNFASQKFRLTLVDLPKYLIQSGIYSKINSDQAF